MPAYAVGAVVLIYWGYVVAKLIRVRRRARWRKAAIPRQPLERIMWLIWVPLIILWIALPLIAENQSLERHPWMAIPAAMRGVPGLVMRWAGAILSIVAFLGSLACWRFMGRCWRMAVDEEMTTLLTSGPFNRVRHPIYSLSILLMIGTALAVPSRAMLVVAAIHVTLLVTKAANEEKFLRRTHGQAYDAYARRTGRFLPRWPTRSAEEMAS